MITSRCAAMIVSMADRNGSGLEPVGGGSGSSGRTMRTMVAPVMSKIAERPMVNVSTRRPDLSVGMTVVCPDRLVPNAQ
jgi:hypothetical protein